MKKDHIIKFAAFLFAISRWQLAYCNMILPAMALAQGIFIASPLAIITIFIEALLFYWLLKDVSVYKAFYISLFGNAVSTLLGTLIMVLIMPLLSVVVPYDELFLGGTFTDGNLVVTYILMCIGSGLVELLAIKSFFGYPAKKLWIPVFLGNFLTYTLIAFFQFRSEIMTIFGGNS